MKFNFMLSRDAQAGDQVDDMRDQLEALGHEFEVNRGIFLPPPWVNIFAEGVSEVNENPQLIQSLAKAGYQIVVLITEEPTLVTNEGLVWNYRTTDDWIGRADCFVEWSGSMTAAWCYAPDTARIIKRFVPRAADIDMVWGKRFKKPLPPPRTSLAKAANAKIAPRHDFCFFGSLTRRRAMILDEFIHRGHSVDVIPHATSLIERDKRLRYSRVVLDLKQYPWWNLVSSVRYVTAIGHGRPVVAEARSLRAQGEWARIVRFAPEGGFYDAAAEVLSRWEEVHEQQLAALKRKPSVMAAAVAILPAPPDIILPAVQAPKGPPKKPIWTTGRVQNVVHSGPRARLVESYGGVNLVEWKGFIYSVPHRLGRVHLEEMDLSGHQEIMRYPDLGAARRGVG